MPPSSSSSPSSLSSSWNPFAFRPAVVSIVTTLVYLAIFIPLLIIHETVPAAPRDASSTAKQDVNLTEAWLDLSHLTSGYHPYNSHRNDEVRDWLLRRIEAIVTSNNVSLQSDSPHRSTSAAVTIFDDVEANYTGTALTSIGVAGRRAGISTYFEGNNIIVYIRGTDDATGDWWNAPTANLTHDRGGVLVNAHFDSVSTGYGATDNGMGVITTLQLIRHFSAPAHTPKRGIVALLNNGEEDGLYGAKAFLSHPTAAFVHTFLNLEGAGAGGRATLFRSTDTEVTRAYAGTKHPFGTVVSADGFATGLVRSETDYVVFRAEGLRGLDVAFWEPRARYHTDQDDAKHTSKDSLWHMLSASLGTLEYLSSDRGDEFDGERGDGSTRKVHNGHGSDGVWFDLFGKAFAVFSLHTLFAWSVTLLVVSPIVLIALTFTLAQCDKYYFFTGSVKTDDDAALRVPIDAWRGAFRLPIVLAISGGVTVGAAFLLRKVNPFIVFSSQYAVWAMSLSLFFIVFWFLMAGCNFVRPSALHRGYVLIWMFALSWLLLVAATIGQNRYQLGGSYLFVFLEASIFLATLIALCEHFALPAKFDLISEYRDEHEIRQGFEAIPQSDGNDQLDGEGQRDPADATETTPLFRHRRDRRVSDASGSFGATFARFRQSRAPGGAESLHGRASDNDHTLYGGAVFGHEQRWSWALPTWTWLLQFLLIGPFMLIILGQVGLLVVTAMAQTGSDGGSLLTPYLAIAVFSILIFLPLAPFIHRINAAIPTFLLVIFLGTLIYNLVAFPFSPNNRYKAYFQQTVDLDTGLHRVTIAGVEEYVRDIISHIPSASGQEIDCISRPEVRSGLRYCSYVGPAPRVVVDTKPGVPPEKGMRDWLHFNVTRATSGENKARFHIAGQDTKACIVRWDEPFSAFYVHGSANSSSSSSDGGDDDKEGRADVPDGGSDQIKLWHRDWDREWVVDVEWVGGNSSVISSQEDVEAAKKGDKDKDKDRKGQTGRSGRVVCLWSDANALGTIPALDEVQRFAPSWATVTKLMDGLVEGSKAFNV